MELITQGELKRAVFKSFGRGGMARTLLQLMQARNINKFYEEHAGDSPEQFISAVINKLNLRYELNEEDLAKIPVTGPFITISNHPFGGIDGLLLIHTVSKVRPDYKIVANVLLHRIAPLRDFLLPVNPFDNSQDSAHTISGIKNAFTHLQQNNCLGLFPSGEVSSYSRDEKIVTDCEWKYSILKFIQKADVPVIPIHFQGRNRSRVNLISILHPLYKSSELPQEFFNRRNRSIKIRIGNPVAVKDQKAITDISRFGRFLRMKTYTLGSPIEVRKFYGYQVKNQGEPEKIADPVPFEIIKEEFQQIEKLYMLFKIGNYKVFCAPSYEIPNILNEIGRLRELTFRRVGEGTNKSIDLDEFDLYYHHLFIWDSEKEMIVGAYRVGMGKEIIAQYGKKGFYLHSLFRMDDPMLPVLSQALELGRSFIREEYQQKPMPLFLLWKGILYLLLKNKDYRYLIGPVSISNQFSKMSKALITEFIRSHYFDNELSRYIKPRTEFNVRLAGVDTDIISEATNADINKFDKLIEEIEPANFKLPVLLKKYIKLNAKIIGFNIDPKFNDALDGLILLDLFNVPLETVKSLSKELEDTEILMRFYNNDPELVKKLSGPDRHEQG
jgi:putative hemolysin